MSTLISTQPLMPERITQHAIPLVSTPNANPESHFAITAFSECSDFFYIGTTHGLLQKSKQNGKIIIHTTRNSKLPDNHITSIQCTRQSHTYVGTTSGLAFWDNCNFQNIFKGNSRLCDISISALAKDNQNLLWVGTANSGLFKTTINVDQVFMAQSIIAANHHIHALTMDSNGSVWVGYQDGSFECFWHGFSNYYPSITSIEMAKLKDITPFLLPTPKDGVFLCETNSIHKIASWPSYPEITCSYYNLKHSRMIMSNEEGIIVFDIRNPFSPPRVMLNSEFIRAISCRNRDRAINQLIHLIEDFEKH